MEIYRCLCINQKFLQPIPAEHNNIFSENKGKWQRNVPYGSSNLHNCCYRENHESLGLHHIYWSDNKNVPYGSSNLHIITTINTMKIYYRIRYITYYLFGISISVDVLFATKYESHKTDSKIQSTKFRTYQGFSMLRVYLELNTVRAWIAFQTPWKSLTGTFALKGPGHCWLNPTKLTQFGYAIEWTWIRIDLD